MGSYMITDAKEKACVFNEYFCAQCRLDSESVVLPPLPDITNTRFISNITTTVTEVNNLLKGIDISKACGVDGVGNHLLKLSADGISQSFASIINISFSTGVFPKAWKFANVIPIFKKANRQHKENYRPISLLPALSKIPEKIVFNRLYNFLLDINFLSPYQSGFRPGDSTVNQLIYIVHKIHEALDSGNEVRMGFLDISKAFDKVWHKGLIFKLKTIGVRGPLLNWIVSYLSQRKQRVVINGQSSDWGDIEAGVPQGSVLGPLLFLIYINDITKNLQSNCFLFADDSSLFQIVSDPHSTSISLNRDLEEIESWSRDWLVTINAEKTESITFSTKRIKPYHPPLFYNNTQIKEVSKHIHLGVTLTSNLSWKAHILKIYEKASKRLTF